MLQLIQLRWHVVSGGWSHMINPLYSLMGGVIDVLGV